MDSQELYYPIAVLIEELRNEDVQLRLNSIRQLKTIAIALGPEKTRNQLVPFLSETLCDEDEVLYALAEQLATLVPYLGSADGAYCLLPPLENLATVEDVAVRDKAIESLRYVLTLPGAQEIDLCGCPLVERLSEGAWYTSRIAASALISVLYPRVRVYRRKELQNILKKLSEDDAPAVRRAVAGRLGEIAIVMNTDHSVDDKIRSQLPSDGGSSGGDSNTQTKGSSSSSSSTSSSSDQPAVKANSTTESAVPHLTDFGGDSTEDKNNGREVSDVQGSLKVVWDPILERANLRRLVFPTYCHLLEDDHESVRLMALESMVDIIRCLDPSDTETILERVIRPAYRDQAWRVRCVLAEKFVDIFTLLEPATARQSLMPLFTSLLCDDEAEVRAVVASKIKPIVRCLLGLPPVDPNSPTPLPAPSAHRTSSDNPDSPVVSDANITESASVVTAGPPHTTVKLYPDTDVNVDEISALAAADRTIMNSLLPALKARAGDTNSHVRCALASAIVSLAPLFGKQLTLNHLLPLLLAYLEDGNADVRFNLISNFEHLNSVTGLDQITCLLPWFMELAEDPAWRVRLVLIDYMPLLAKQLGVKLFDAELSGVCLAWLADEVYAIREAAVENICRLGSIFGPDWTKNTYLPKILQLATDMNYLRRMICLEGVMRLSEQVDPTVCKQHLIPVVLQMQADHVPNVRFKVAQALSKVGERVDRSDVDDRIRPCLLQLSKDLDQDVKYYAEEALEKLHISTDKPWNSDASQPGVDSSLQPPLADPAAATLMESESPCEMDTSTDLGIASHG